MLYVRNRPHEQTEKEVKDDMMLLLHIYMYISFYFL